MSVLVPILVEVDGERISTEVVVAMETGSVCVVVTVPISISMEAVVNKKRQ